MWDKPHLLNAIADLLYAAAAAVLLTAFVLWAVRVPSLPIRQVVASQELRHIRQDELERVLVGRLSGNFFSLDVKEVQAAVETLPWVRRVEVRRKWPSRLELGIEEHVPVGRWEDGANHSGKNELVNSYGEVFVAVLGGTEAARLPQLFGPAGTAREVLRQHEEFARILAPIGLKPARVRLSPRLAWQIRLENGMLIELGREQSKSPVGVRLARFVEIYPGSVGNRQALPAVIDLRYPNGFALREKG
ncbi:MAG: Cell division protein FtsQ [Betaproteobacteria bacterium ADurb.Bin341]|nr:MAG: Cell division protein FtsQ [Betaproteobacteria bacterium ADurb.Bin341]